MYIYIYKIRLRKKKNKLNYKMIVQSVSIRNLENGVKHLEKAKIN